MNEHHCQGPIHIRLSLVSVSIPVQLTLFHMESLIIVYAMEDLMPLCYIAKLCLGGGGAELGEGNEIQGTYPTLCMKHMLYNSCSRIAIIIQLINLLPHLSSKLRADILWLFWFGLWLCTFM